MTAILRTGVIWMLAMVCVESTVQLRACGLLRQDERPQKLTTVAGDVESLRQSLLEGDGETQIAAAVQLGALGPFAHPAVDAVIRGLHSENPAVQYECIFTLGEIGPIAHAAADQLTPFLQHAEPFFQAASLESLRRLGNASPEAVVLIRQLCRHTNPAVSAAAVRCLLKLGPDQEGLNAGPGAAVDAIVHSAIPLLVAALGDSSTDVRNEVAVALIEIGESVVPAVSAQLTHADPVVRRTACEILGRVGRAAAAAVPAVLLRLEDSEQLVVRAAIAALGEMQTAPETVLPRLSPLLTHPSATIRITAVRAIAGFGRTAADLSPQVVLLLSDGNTVVRVSAADALGRIGGDRPEVVQPLVTALSDSSGGVTVRAANALSQIGAPAVPALLPLLSEPGYRSLVVELLGEMGAGAESAVPALVPLLSSEDRELRREVFIALASLGAHAKAATPELMRILQDAGAGPSRGGAAYVLAHLAEPAAVPALRELIDDDDPMNALSAAWALAVMLPQDAATAERVLPQLLQAAESENELIRREVLRAISGFGPSAASARDILLHHAMADSVAAVRAEALHGLAEIQASAEHALPAALAAVNDPHPLVRNAARYLLGRLGDEAQSAVPHLRASLRRGDEFERILSAWALVRISPSADTSRAAVPLMLAALQQVNPRVRIEAARVLGEFAEAAPNVISALEAVRNDDDAAVREAAAMALTQLQQRP